MKLVFWIESFIKDDNSVEQSHVSPSAPHRSSIFPPPSPHVNLLSTFCSPRFAHLRDRINSFFQEGILSKLTIAFSRDEDDVSGPKCRYVQDLMRTHKKELADLVMNQEAVIYVCGSVVIPWFDFSFWLYFYFTILFLFLRNKVTVRLQESVQSFFCVTAFKRKGMS